MASGSGAPSVAEHGSLIGVRGVGARYEGGYEYEPSAESYSVMYGFYRCVMLLSPVS